VRYTQLVRQKRRKPAGRSIGAAWRGTGSVSEGRLGARGGSRRSGYAFSHQEGFGELITSGKNMRLSSLALANFASKHSSSWIETLRKKKNTHTPPSTSGECSPAPSNMSGMGPALSNSSSVLGGSQETPIEEETDTAVVLSSSSHPAALEQAEPRASAQVAPPDSSTSAAASTESPGGWTLSLETVQEALFGRRGCASASYSQGPPSDARETPHTD
ncbi:hypothetical protein CHARACLAT_031626, partial [Characodon lateralis]|nr:hypothetical protein [Characodon lateralis]